MAERFLEKQAATRKAAASSVHWEASFRFGGPACADAPKHRRQKSGRDQRNSGCNRKNRKDALAAGRRRACEELGMPVANHRTRLIHRRRSLDLQPAPPRQPQPRQAQPCASRCTAGNGRHRSPADARAPPAPRPAASPGKDKPPSPPAKRLPCDGHLRGLVPAILSTDDPCFKNNKIGCVDANEGFDWVDNEAGSFATHLTSTVTGN